MRRSVRALEEAVIQTKAAAVSTGLVINERKSKYTNRNVTDLEIHLIMVGRVYEGIVHLRYFGTLID